MKKQNALRNSVLCFGTWWLLVAILASVTALPVIRFEREGLTDGLNPEQIHIAFGDNPSEMVILWATQHYANEKPVVHYGIDENLNMSASGTSALFYRANQEGLHNYHRVKLKNLQEDTLYHYSAHSGGSRSSIYHFKTMKNSQNWSPEFVIYGDLGRGGGAPTLRRLKYEATTGRYTAFIHVGDFAYNLDDEGGQRGDQFMTRIQPIAATVPYMTCPGNHELYFDFVHYRNRFSMPQSTWPMPVDKLWFSFDVASVHFISYSSEVFFTYDGKFVQAQYDWLVQDLIEANQKANREKRPWIIAFGHRPMYCSNLDRDDCTKEKSLVREGLEELFRRHGVDLIIQGHEHSYERFYPMYNDTVTSCDYVNPRAPVHILTGAAGCNEQEGLCADVILKPKGPWSAFRVWLPGLNSYGRMRVFNNTHLYIEQVIGWNGQVMDSVWIEQNHHGPFPELNPDAQKITSCHSSQ